MNVLSFTKYVFKIVCEWYVVLLDETWNTFHMCNFRFPDVGRINIIWEILSLLNQWTVKLRRNTI